MDLIPHMRRAYAFAHRTIAGVEPAQLGDSTPCAEWDVATLVNHMANGNRRYHAAARGAAAPEQMDDVRETGIDTAAGTYATAADGIVTAWEEQGFERTVDMPFGTVPAPVAFNIMFLEACSHGWDLATATDQPTDLDEETAAAALEVARGMFAAMPNRAPAFKPEQPAPKGASTLDRLAAFMGRAVPFDG